VDLTPDEVAEYADDVGLSARRSRPGDVCERAQELRPKFRVDRRRAVCAFIAQALSHSTLSRDERAERLQAFCDGFGVRYFTTSTK
jgi:hypothetical protein